MLPVAKMAALAAMFPPAMLPVTVNKLPPENVRLGLAIALPDPLKIISVSPPGTTKLPVMLPITVPIKYPVVVILPAADISPTVTKLPPVTFPVTPSVPVTLAPAVVATKVVVPLGANAIFPEEPVISVNAPVSTMLPVTFKLPPEILPVTVNDVSVPTLVILGCAAVDSVPAMLVPDRLPPVMLPEAVIEVKVALVAPRLPTLALPVAFNVPVILAPVVVVTRTVVPLGANAIFPEAPVFIVNAPVSTMLPVTFKLPLLILPAVCTVPVALIDATVAMVFAALFPDIENSAPVPLVSVIDELTAETCALPM